ncbi:UBP1-associated protein 2B-like isoform X1 [Tripterygium wilfordii]|uniref:UBP1-associated protein 2B-like isoform X1 n=1 Tax=Tripterygium wilfordii TaxID=458696 RepID=A0A7J7CVE6_TRIWF|nr:UBP1-associated protein 2B-like isoform X1 [Tripterygium wilfordii]
MYLQLLEPYTKDQLIDLISGFAINDASLRSLICRHADGDVSHRKIFVHGLSWDSTSQTLLSAFQPFGEIEDCNIVTDNATGKAKGYGFVLFKTRKAASKALENSSIKIDNRIVSYQLASFGPVNAAGKDQDPAAIGARKIYVRNVQVTIEAEKLREFFERFGEIEAGPLGFDPLTVRSKGYALFVYKTLAGAKKALEEPYKIFEGHQLHCQKAADGKNKNSIQAGQKQQQVQGQTQHQQQMFSALAAAQQMPLFGQYPGLNHSMEWGQGLQHAYPNVQGGQLAVGMGAGRVQGSAGSLSGFPSQMRCELSKMDFFYDF